MADLVWGSMVYGCRDEPRPAHPPPPGWDNIVAMWRDHRDDDPPPLDADGMIPATEPGCGYEVRYFLGMGVEGPPAAQRRVPCAFVCGRCPNCGLPLTHVDWNRNERFPEPREVEPGESYFRVKSWDDQAEFVKGE